jgi:hypothetical protein
MSRRGIGLLGGVTVLLAGVTGYALLAGGSDERSSAANDGVDPTPGASASQYPGPTESPKPSRTSTSPSPQPTTEKTVVQDVHYGNRRTAAERYDRCDVSGFTNGGVVKTDYGKRLKLNMGITYEQDPASVELRAKGESDDLHWNNPVVIAAPIGKGGKVNDDDILKFRSKTDRLHQNSSVYLPVNPGKGTDYAIGVLTNAISPFGEGEMETITVTYCNTIENQGGNEWRQSAYDDTIPEITSIDIPRP